MRRVRLAPAAPGAIGWLALTVTWSGLLGLLGREMEEISDAAPSTLEALDTRRGTDVLVMLATIVAAAAVACVSVQAGALLASEEGAGRLGSVLSTRQPRWRLWVAWRAVALLASLAVLVISCLSLALSTWMVTGTWEEVSTAWRPDEGAPGSRRPARRCRERLPRHCRDPVAACGDPLVTCR